MSSGPDRMLIARVNCTSHSKPGAALLRRCPTARPGGFDDVDDIASTIESQKRDQRRLKMACLKRDGGQCMVTGAWAEEYSGAPEDAQTTPTQAVHILPFSLGSFGENQRVSIATIWDAIYRMFPDIRNNVMTMNRLLHSDFGEFRFCFLTTERPNRYKFKHYKISLGLAPLPEYVEFTAHSGLHQLPSPELLRLHAAVAQVLHASGLARFIDDVHEDWDMIRCLAEDGSTPISRLLLAV